MKTLVVVKQEDRPDRHLLVTTNYRGDADRFAEFWTGAVEKVQEENRQMGSSSMVGPYIFDRILAYLKLDRWNVTELLSEQISVSLPGCDHPRVYELNRQDEVTASVRCRVCGKDMGWWCPNNIKNFCEYDSEKDPMHDNCIHCRHPEERK